jgi:glycosyl transferase family 25
MQQMPIYIIKMPNSHRNPGLAKSLNALNLTFQIQEAVVGKKLTSEQIVKNVNLRGCDARLGYRISKSLIGCGLSHRESYKKFLGTGSEWALILEEDVVIEDLNFTEIYQALETCKSVPTIIQLFTRSTRLMDKKSIIQIGSGTRIVFNFKPRVVGSGTPAYVINRLAAQKAFSDKKLDGAPDWPRWAQGVSQKGIYPWMVYETEIGSTIILSSTSRRDNFRRRLLQLTGIHYLIFLREYSGPVAYFREEISPYLFYLYWRFRGSRYYLNDFTGPQIF